MRRSGVGSIEARTARNPGNAQPRPAFARGRPRDRDRPEHADDPLRGDAPRCLQEPGPGFQLGEHQRRWRGCPDRGSTETHDPLRRKLQRLLHEPGRRDDLGAAFLGAGSRERTRDRPPQPTDAVRRYRLRPRIQVARRRAPVAEGSAGSRCGRRAGLDDLGSCDRPGAARCSVRGDRPGRPLQKHRRRCSLAPRPGRARRRAHHRSATQRHCVCGRRVLWWASSPLPVEDHERRPHLGRRPPQSRGVGRRARDRPADALHRLRWRRRRRRLQIRG